MTAIGLENPDYVEQTKARWGKCLPVKMGVVEFCGTGDRFFGGNADDRPLGVDRLILERASNEPRAEFMTIEDAHDVAKTIANRRPDSILGVMPRWR